MLVDPSRQEFIPGRGPDRRRHRAQRSRPLPALPAPRLQAEPVRQVVLARVRLPRLALRPPGHEGEGARAGAARHGPLRGDRGGRRDPGPRHEQDHPRLAPGRARPARPRAVQEPDRVHLMPAVAVRVDARIPMTDQPGQEPEERLPGPAASPPRSRPRERFTAPRQAHTVGLSPERAAKIVRQSGSSRWVAFLAVSLVAIFVIGYFFYELGVPGIEDSSRLEKEIAAQQVTDVERGAKLYQANCSRCHGATGAGRHRAGPQRPGEAPDPPDAASTSTTVLTVGGRYVCGDPNSLMLAWLEPKGPLNYRQRRGARRLHPGAEHADLLRGATRRPARSRSTTGWRDPSYAMPAGATPVPDCWKDAFGGGGGTATPAPSGAPTAAAFGRRQRRRGRDAQAHGVRDRLRHGQPGGAGQHALPDRLHEQRRRDPPQRGHPRGLAHGTRGLDRARSSTGWRPGPTTCRPSPRAAYGFVCTVHPNMTGTLTAK